MKIVAWNVNGLRACWEKGLESFIQTCGADIICLQETKTQSVFSEIENMGYYAYWSFSERPKYSGTLCLTKHKPIQVSYGIGNEEFDREGRVITLSFGQFYVVNCYVPNSQSSINRACFRMDWDVAFREYLCGLNEMKPVIVTGDFNVARSYIDIFPENLRNEEHPAGFLQEERDGMEQLLASGFVDSFRYLHPKTTGADSWWSNRLNKRSENRGWRLDYCLCSTSLQNKIKSAGMCKDVYGSDHCPIYLDISVRIDGVSDEMSKTALARLWDSYDWDAAEQELLEKQQALSKAGYAKSQDAIEMLQKKIVRSLSSKMLAVRHVCSAKRTPGIDGVIWETSEQKAKAALSLTGTNYKAQPCRHIVIEPKNSKRRIINIPTYYDRAMQVLYAFSLNPLAEASGERKSFAFRKGRSLQDVNEYIKRALEASNAPCYLIKTDVKACYESISHEWLLSHIPMDKRILKEFLTSGYVFHGEIFPTEDYGISLGFNISPILGNMVLDGMQKYIYDCLYGERERDYQNGELIRFADDALVFVRAKQDSEKVLYCLSEFLLERGLRLSEEKTSVLSVEEGFDFLSRHYEKHNGIVTVRPSEIAVARFQENLENCVLHHKGSQKGLIDKLNKKLDGFAAYHRISDASYAFRQIDTFLKALLLKSCQLKHPHWSRERILEKYWFLDYDGQYVFALKDLTGVQVKRISDTIIIKHQRIKTNANPYLDVDYFEARTEKQAIFNVTGKYKQIWNRQQGRCHYCGKPILTDQYKAIVPIDFRRGNGISNLAYIHKSCQCSLPEYIATDTMPICETDIISLIHSLEVEQGRTKSKFFRLEKYFSKCTELSICLTFQEIEKIIGEPLCDSAYRYGQYWHLTNNGAISRSWRDNGYRLQHLLLDQKKAVFHRVEKENIPVHIPKILLSGRIPPDAKYKLERSIHEILKSYGLPTT